MSKDENVQDVQKRSWKRLGVMAAALLTVVGAVVGTALYGQALAFSAFGLALTSMQTMIAAGVVGALLGLAMWGADKWYYGKSAGAASKSGDKEQEKGDAKEQSEERLQQQESKQEAASTVVSQPVATVPKTTVPNLSQ
jgi:hypothetical protein